MDYCMDLALRQIKRKVDKAPGDTYNRYAWCRRKAEYLMRLMFAVTTDVVLRTRKVDTRNIFSRKPIFDCTMGAMINTAKDLLRQLPPESINEETQRLSQVWEVLNNIRVLRNDDAHDGTPPEELDLFISENESWFQEVYNITGGKYFQLKDEADGYRRFLVYVRDSADHNGNAPCISISPIGDLTCLVKQNERGLYRCGVEAHQEPDEIKGQLYLQITQVGSTEVSYYRLSPFLLWDDNTEQFLLCQTMLQSLQSEITLKYISLLMQKAEQRYCCLRSLIPCEQTGPYYVYKTRKTQRLEINLRDTNDDGVQHLANRESRYCAEICPQWEQVFQYCKNRPYRYCVICGEGGLGKTALAIHIINNCILAGETDYKRVIFLSAKKYYPQYNRSLSEGGIGEKQVTPDFRSYSEFLLQLSKLLLYREKDRSESSKSLDAHLLKKINVQHIIPEALLLVVDDLDSLPPEEQKQIISFINQITNSQVFVLVTTRSEETSGLRIRLERLNAKDCITFLDWYLEQKNKALRHSLSWDMELVRRITEGRPYDLQHLANLVCQLGRPFEESEISIFRKLLTPQERTFYLCRTSLQQLNAEERQLFQFLCGMNTALCHSLPESEEAREDTNISPEKHPVREDISVRMLLYMQMDGLQSKETLDAALRKLQDVCLLENRNEKMVVRVRPGIVYTALLHSDGQSSSLPEYLQQILDRVRQAPGEWSADKFIETLLPYLRMRLDNLLDFQESHERQMVQSMWEDQDNFSKMQLDKLKKIRSILQRNINTGGIQSPVMNSFQRRLDALWDKYHRLLSCMSDEYDELYRELWTNLDILKEQAKTPEQQEAIQALHFKLANE